MRISELAQASGVPLPTVKYYLRTGILHPGTAVTARLSTYDETHVRRLRLLRVLREVGDVPVGRLQALTRAVEAETSVHDLFAVAADALAPQPPAPDAIDPTAHELARQLIDDAGWRIRDSSPDRANLAAALGTLMGSTGRPLPPQALVAYVQAADRMASREIALLDDAGGRAAVLEQMVVGQVVFGQILAILRRLAEEHHSLLRFGQPD